VHDITAGKYFKSLYDLSKVYEGSFFRKGSLLLHEFVQCSSVAILINEVEVVGSLKHIDIFDDIWTALQGGKNVDFIDCAFL
jgi:hypothetical protein